MEMASHILIFEACNSNNVKIKRKEHEMENFVICISQQSSRYDERLAMLRKFRNLKFDSSQFNVLRPDPCSQFKRSEQWEKIFNCFECVAIRSIDERLNSMECLAIPCSSRIQSRLFQLWDPVVVVVPFLQPKFSQINVRWIDVEL